MCKDGTFQVVTSERVPLEGRRIVRDREE